MNWIEWVGYAASLGIMISMLMSSVLKLRMINLAGCVLFIVYGYMIGAYPVAIVNFFIALINIYYLRKMLGKTESFFSVMEMDADDAYVRKFLDFYWQDIRNFMPEINREMLNHDECWLLLKDMKVAGIFMGGAEADNTLEIHLDYLLPEYRDFKVGKFLYENKKELFLKKSYKRLIAQPGNKRHNRYLKKMGFKFYNNVFQRDLIE
ncbi:MAG TPA: GNAT family N-acetyltransferase [Bacteroidales bacterium]|nr:GNAT family N-acetyltransferase [Bacteroidales bacterium]